MKTELNKISKRISVLEMWISKNGNNCKHEQAHLNKNSNEHVYWNYGYLMALKDTYALLSKAMPHKQDIYS